MLYETDVRHGYRVRAASGAQAEDLPGAHAGPVDDAAVLVSESGVHLLCPHRGPVISRCACLATYLDRSIQIG